MKKLKSKFVEEDGTLNGKVIAGVVSLLIVLVQQVLYAFGIKFTGNWGAIVAVINTLLTIGGLIGVVSDVSPVTSNSVQAVENNVKETTDPVAKSLGETIDKDGNVIK